MLLNEDGHCLYGSGRAMSSVLVRDTVANLLDVGLDDLLKADEAEVTNAVMRVCVLRDQLPDHARRNA
jgi:hypothetical protein